MARLSISKRYLEELVQATLQDEILEVTIQVPEEGRLRVTGRIVVEEAPEEIRGFLEEMLMTELPGWDVEVDGLFISPELLPNLPFKAQQIAQFPEAVYFIEKVKTNLFRIWVRHQSLFLSKKRNRISKLRDAFPEATLEFRALGSEEDITLLRTLPAVQAWIAPFVKNVSGLAPENFHAYRTDRNKQSIWLAHNSDISFPALRTLRHRIMSATDVLAVFEYRMSRADARAKLEAALTALGWIESYHVSFQEKHSIFLVSVDTEQSRMEALAGIARRLAEDTGFRVEMKIDVERDSMIVRLAKAFPEDGILTWIKHVDASLYEVEAYIPFDPQRERLEAWSDEMEESWGAKILFSDPFMRSPDFRFRELRGDDAETIAKRYNRPGEFSPSALALAEELASIHWEEALTQRLDFRETPVMSIDPVRTKDLDDALSITSLEEGGFEVGVHIADVAPFVPQGSALDQEALSRGFTTYLVEGEIPVIPPALSDQACSLHGGQDSLALSVFIRMDAMGLMQDFEVKRCVIHNWKRFSYAEVQAILNGGDHEFSWQILTLGRLSRLMRASRKAAGALDLSLDDDPEKESHQLIEEFMLQANECVSRFLGEKHPAGVCLFRIHPDVTDNSMEALNQLAQHLKIQVKIKDQGTMQRALEAVLGTSQFDIFRFHVGRVLEKAIYHVDQLGHGALAKEDYAHFTSPIRRYTDLIIHRLIEDVLCLKERGGTSCYSREDLQVMADHLNHMEIRVDAASYESHRLKDLQHFDGARRSYEGRILSFMRGRITVKLEQTDLLVHVRYQDLQQQSLMPTSINDEFSGRYFSLGEGVTIRTDGVDWRSKSINARIVG